MEKFKRQYHGLITKKIKPKENYLQVFLQLVNKVVCCANCQSMNIDKHGKSSLMLHDLPFQNKKVYLYIERNRYKCQVCKKTFFDDVPQKIPHTKVTFLLAESIRQKCNKISQNQLSKILKIDRKVITKIINI